MNRRELITAVAAHTGLDPKQVVNGQWVAPEVLAPHHGDKRVRRGGVHAHQPCPEVPTSP